MTSLTYYDVIAILPHFCDLSALPQTKNYSYLDKFLTYRQEVKCVFYRITVERTSMVAFFEKIQDGDRKWRQTWKYAIFTGFSHFVAPSGGQSLSTPLDNIVVLIFVVSMHFTALKSAHKQGRYLWLKEPATTEIDKNDKFHRLLQHILHLVYFTVAWPGYIVSVFLKNI